MGKLSLTKSMATAASSISLALLLSLITPPASAGIIYQLDATAAAFTVSFNSNFSLLFDDLDGDTTLSFNELLSFSGVTYGSTSTYYDLIAVVPVIVGVADGSAPANNNRWLFARTIGGPANLPIEFYTYDVNVAPPTAAPLPGTLALLGFGLAGLGYSRRKKA